MNKRIYLDHAATTATRPEVIEAMLPYLGERYGNPSGLYSLGIESKKAIDNARLIIAEALGTEGENIYFTGGGSESDNWAIKGVADAFSKKGRHIITSKIEHHAVLNSCRYLETKGFAVTYLGVGENGIVRPESVYAAIRPDTIMVSIMYANNEIGSIQPIKEIGGITRRQGVIFHTDAVQAFGQLPIDVDECNIDMLSASGHKLQGPKGTGFLYVRKGIDITNLIHGGKQEAGRRAGTENVPGIVGIGRATQLALEDMDNRIKNECELRDYLINRVLDEIPYSRLNGHRYKRLPNNVNFSFQFIDAEPLLVMLDMSGICASAGSACNSGIKKPSYVLEALGLPEDVINGTVRFTIGGENTVEDIDYTVDTLKEIVGKLRESSPLYEDYKRYNKI